VPRSTLRFLSLLVVTGLQPDGLPARAAEAEPLRIVAFGDSTTAPRGDLVVYAMQLEAQLNAQPGVSCRVINAGQGGNTSTTGRARLSAVLEARPALVIVQFGINDSTVDVWKKPPATVPRVSLETYRDNLRYFAEAFRAAGAQVIMMTPNPLVWTPGMRKRYGRPPYDPDRADGFNRMLAAYAEAAREVAQELRVPLVDVARAYAELAPDAAANLLSDGMHPNQRGHDLVARLLVDLITRQPSLLEPQLSPPTP
jgi:lysophospholipase L1-like esterase